MKHHLRALSKDSVIYGLGSTAVGLISFLLLPVFARYLSPEEYGIFTVLTLVQSALEVVAGLGLSSAFFRYYGAESDTSQKLSVLNTCFWIQALACALVAVFLNLAAPLLAAQLFDVTQIETAFPPLVYSIWTGVLNAFVTLGLCLFRSERRPVRFASIQFSRAAASALFALFLITRGAKYEGVVFAYFVVAAFSALLMIVYWISTYLRKSEARFSKPIAIKLLTFGVPVLISNLFSFGMSFSDRFFLNHYLSAADVGIYSFGSKLASILNLGLIAPFSAAVVPYAFSISNQPDFRETYSKVLKYFLLAGGALGLMIHYFSQELIALVGSQAYGDAWKPMGYLLISSLLFGLYYVVSVGIDLAEKTYLTTFAIVAAGLTNIFLNFVLTPRYGITGAALAGVASNGALFLITFFLSQKAYRMPYSALRVTLFLAALVLFGVLPAYTSSGNFTSAFVKVAALLVFVIVCFCGLLFDKADRSLWIKAGRPT